MLNISERRNQLNGTAMVLGLSRRSFSLRAMTWNIEFFEDDRGRQPVREWLQSLDAKKRAIAIAAVETFLTEMGLGICGTEHGKQLGKGLFELRIRDDEILLRIFCHAHGDKIVLLLGGYDKGARPGTRHQDKEIEKARKRLRSFTLQKRREKIGKRRRA